MSVYHWTVKDGTLTELFYFLVSSDTHGVCNSPTAAVVDTCLGIVAPLVALPALANVFFLDTLVVCNLYLPLYCRKPEWFCLFQNCLAELIKLVKG